MTVRVTREAEPQIEIYGAYSGELLGSGNGIRATVTFTPTDKYLILVVKGDLDMVQLEAGAFPTSYIPTTGATATRAADICSIATSAFGYNQGAGTIVVEASMTGINSGVYPRIWDLGTATGTASLWANLSTVFLDKAGVGTVTSKAWTKDDTIAAAMSRQDSAIAIGASVSTSTTVVDLVAVNNLTIGASEGSSTQFLNGHIKSIAYYPRRLTNAQIQALTA